VVALLGGEDYPTVVRYSYLHSENSLRQMSELRDFFDMDGLADTGEMGVESPLTAPLQQPD